MTPTLFQAMILVFVASVVGSFGAVFLKLGAAKLNRSLTSFLNSRLLVGVALYLGSSAFYALGLRGGQLSVLYPMISLGYVWTLLWSRLFFHETLNGKKFLGLGLVLLGVVFVGMGSG